MSLSLSRKGIAVRLMIVLVAILLPGALGILAQGGDLKRLNEEVARGRQELQRLDRERADAARSLADYRRQAARIDSALERLRREEFSAARELDSLQHERDSISAIIQRLRHELGLSSRALVRGVLTVPPTSALLMPKEEAAAELRSRVVARWSAKGRRHVISLSRAALNLAARDAGLRQLQSLRARKVEARRAELADLLEMTRNQAASLERNRAERDALSRLVEEKNREASAIAAMVARSAPPRSEQPVARSTERRPSRSTTTSPADSTPARRDNGTTSAAEKKAPVEEGGGSRAGRFRWPSGSRTIVEGYGQRTNPRTGTVTLNPGINIGAPAGSPVLAAADGTVTAVSWLPRYGTVVILEHAGGWRTVYGNLSSSSVSRGTRVSSGQNLGPVARSIEGEFLHFEIWRGNSRVNPTTLLH